MQPVQAARENTSTRRRGAAVRVRGRRGYVAAESQRRAGDERREMARARGAARLAGRRLTSAALSTNERPRRGDVSRLAVANFRGEVDRLVHDYQPRRLVSPSCSLVPSLFLSRTLRSLRLVLLLPRALLLRPSLSHARTHALSLGSQRDFLKSLFQARSRTRGELVEARATAPVF